eukprot:scaffold221039_cov37-Tisochrysis_lutea.AAC.1
MGIIERVWSRLRAVRCHAASCRASCARGPRAPALPPPLDGSLTVGAAVAHRVPRWEIRIYQ